MKQLIFFSDMEKETSRACWFLRAFGTTWRGISSPGTKSDRGPWDIGPSSGWDETPWYKYTYTRTHTHTRPNVYVMFDPMIYNICMTSL